MKANSGHFISVDTAITYPLSEPRWCDDYGGLLDIEFEPSIDRSLFAGRPPNLWRYREVFPFFDESNIVSFDEGMTPLLAIPVAGRAVQFKADYLFPSGSYKDRGSTVLISYLRALGVTEVVQDSSGNAAASVAQYCARAGVDCEVFVPETASPSKIDQILSYGSVVTKVAGSRESTAEAACRAAKTRFYASHVWHPMYFHGTKTFAYEVCEQLGWHAPDTIILPVSAGALMLGVFIGLTELNSAGVIDKVPKLVGVQTEKCSPIYNAFQSGNEDIEPVIPEPTIAEGIAASNPKRGRQLLHCMRSTHGQCLRVTEDEIASALATMCRQGFFIEPTAAVAVAGTSNYIEQFADKDESIVSVLSGSGLKAARQVANLISDVEGLSF